jgi:iron complex outermembrane recepter protein
MKPRMFRQPLLRKYILYEAGLALAMMTGIATAAETNQPVKPSNDLENLTLEQLVNVKVTSVAKKETDAFASPAAITVIAQDDIQRNGFTSIPDALRIVPGMDVAQINASQWAVSSRGFNSQFADELLVLVDGRSVYTPAFSGVYWELQDLMMEDLDRIEIIRGPGAALWGDNAVNGVINITTKSASETQGGLISTSYGTDNQSITSMRYGGQLASNLFFRVYLKYESEDGFLNSMGNRMPDGWDALLGGSRMDWEPNPNDRFTVEGDYVAANLGGSDQVPQLTPPYETTFSGVNQDSDGNLEGRWTHAFSSGSQLTLQTYYDHSVAQTAQILSTVDVYDIDLQDHFAWGDRQDIVLGAGFRDSRDTSPPTFNLIYYPEHSYTTIYNVFAQDNVALVQDRLHLTLGTKIDHTTYGGFDYQPDGRLLWTPSENQTVWMAVSRAVSIPSQLEEASRYNDIVFPTASGPAVVSILGNPNFKPEELLAYQLGYRITPAPNWSFDVAAYYNVYHGVRTNQMGATYFEAAPVPHLVIPETWENALSGDCYGAEVSAQWKPFDRWLLAASYSWLRLASDLDNSITGDGPQQQFQIHSDLGLTRNINFNSSLYYVGGLPDQSVPSYFRLDIGLNWRLNKSWEIGVFGQNLLHTGTVEYESLQTPALTEIPRSVFGRITFRF